MCMLSVWVVFLILALTIHMINDLNDTCKWNLLKIHLLIRNPDTIILQPYYSVIMSQNSRDC